MLSQVEIAVFLIGSFVAALVTSLAGFAFALVALAIWLYVLTPLQAAPLVAAYALLVQGYAVWKLRRSLNARRLAPFLIGTVVGLPLGLAALSALAAVHLRVAVGILLILFSAYNLWRPALPQVRSGGQAADAGVGLFNGMVGGATGLAGIAVVVWSALRGWPRDEQRAVFQPTAITTFAFMILALAGSGMITRQSAMLFLAGLPALALGTWLGWLLYGKLDEDAFRKLTLGLVLASGLALVATAE